VLELPVGDCMTSRVHTCTRADTLEKLMGEMTAHRFRHLPVVEDGELIGIVSIGDVVKQRIAETEMEAAVLRDYIKTG
jgi:CBS domain-containing protein